MLMSGTDHHLAGLGQMAEFTRRSRPHHNKPGHEGYLTENVATLPEVLRESGYYTLMSGKWHLGLRPENAPVSRGFTRSISMLAGAANHYNYLPDFEEKDVKLFAESATAALHIENDKYIDTADLPEDYYSTDFFGDHLIQYLQERPKDQPFFAYLPFTSPHWPIQSPKENSDKYKGKYDIGPVELRKRRLQGLVDKGLLDPSVVPHPVVGFGGPEWDAMTDDQRAASARCMEVYAGMIDRMDYNIGKVLKELKNQGVYDNTVILFMSDNGAEGASYELLPNSGILEHVVKYYDNSLGNIGNGNSFTWIGSDWAQAATAPSRLFKMYSTEGGCRVPFVFKDIKTPREKVVEKFCTVMDIMPTFLDIAGVPRPGSTFNGREVLSMRGESWVPYFKGEAQEFHGSDYVVGWELVGQAALRKGDWKVNFVAAPAGPEKWQLYNISKDPGETEDLAEKYPEKFDELVNLWKDYARTTNVVGLRPELGTVNFDDMEKQTQWMPKETSYHILQEVKAAKVQSA